MTGHLTRIERPSASPGGASEPEGATVDSVPAGDALSRRLRWPLAGAAVLAIAALGMYMAERRRERAELLPDRIWVYQGRTFDGFMADPVNGYSVNSRMVSFDHEHQRVRLQGYRYNRDIVWGIPPRFRKLPERSDVEDCAADYFATGRRQIVRELEWAEYARQED